MERKMTRYKEEYDDAESIEIMERPNDPEQFEEDIRNCEEGELLEKDDFKRWSLYKKDGVRAGKKCKVLKICFYPAAFEILHDLR
jgi:hypothetical protein